jgi:hypothetical protein
VQARALSQTYASVVGDANTCKRVHSRKPGYARVLSVMTYIFGRAAQSTSEWKCSPLAASGSSGGMRIEAFPSVVGKSEQGVRVEAFSSGAGKSEQGVRVEAFSSVAGRTERAASERCEPVCVPRTMRLQNIRSCCWPEQLGAASSA